MAQSTACGVKSLSDGNYRDAFMQLSTGLLMGGMSRYVCDFGKVGLCLNRAVQGTTTILIAEEGVEKIQNGDWFGGGLDLLTAGMSLHAFSKACFAAGTKLLAKGSWGQGWREIELISTDDLVASRDENNPEGTVEWKAVEELFQRTAGVITLTVNGQEIRTTSEHPFYHSEKGWLPAGDLVAGDRLVGQYGEVVIVTKVEAGGEYEAVYNLRVADWHTYFVGDEGWGFGVWAHNTECSPLDQLKQTPQQARRSLRRSMTGIRNDQEAHHSIPRELKDHELVIYAASRGWELNRGSSNGAALGNRLAAVVQHNGSHPRYKTNVENKLDRIVERHGGLNDASYNEFISYSSKLNAALVRLKSKLR